MNKLAKLVAAVVLAVTLSLTVWLAPAARAADMGKGAQVFSANCASCHMGGNNIVNAAKTLKKADLEKYGMASVEAIATQVKKGKAAMPSFLSRLTDEEIDAVANYVLAQAEQGW